MADFDVKNDVTPVQPFDQPHLPSVAALHAAIAGSGVAASYPLATRRAMSKLDLVFVCRTHGIAVVGL